MFEADFLFHVLKLNSCSFHCKEKEKIHIRSKLRTVRLEKTKSKLQNKIDASLENELFLLLPLRRCRKRRYLCRALRRPSPRFWVRNIFKKCEEFGASIITLFKIFETRKRIILQVRDT